MGKKMAGNQTDVLYIEFHSRWVKDSSLYAVDNSSQNVK